MASETHPLAGKTAALNAWLGCLVMIGVAYIEFMVVTGSTPVTAKSFAINGVEFPWALLVWPVASAIYWHQRHVSQTRPRTAFYATMDFIASMAVWVINVVAFLSWIPPVAVLLSSIHVPLAQFNLLSAVIVVVFLLYSFVDIFYWQWRRAEHGHGGVAPDDFENRIAGLDIRIDDETLRRWAKLTAEELGPVLRR